MLFTHWAAAVFRYCMQFEVTDVRPACSTVSPVDDAADDDDDDAWTQRLAKGASVCVECQSLAMRRELGGRCKGHGVMSKETRWAAVATSSSTGRCHGKWVLKSRDQDCQCSSDSPLSFILV